LETIFPANLLDAAKHPAFSTNHLVDTKKTKHKNLQPRTTQETKQVNHARKNTCKKLKYPPEEPFYAILPSDRSWLFWGLHGTVLRNNQIHPKTLLRHYVVFTVTLKHFPSLVTNTGMLESSGDAMLYKSTNYLLTN